MTELSENFRPIIKQNAQDNSFTDPQLMHATTSAKLYRVRKGSKFFMLKTPAQEGGMFLDMLKREYELSIGFDHPHLIHVYAYEPETPVGPAIVMEYVDGRNLTDFLKEQPSTASKRRIFSQLLAAVDCIHKTDIIHNDLKPQNILISRTNNDVKLIDFGLSDNSAHFLMRHMGGTLKYASPELLEQQNDIDARSDIYSIGKIMHDLFGKSYKRIRRKCLQEDRNLRYANVETLQKAWSHRQLPWLILGVVLALIIVTIPSIIYTGYHKRIWRESIENQSQQFDSIATLFDRHVQSRHALAKDSIAIIPYRELSLLPALHFIKYTWDLEADYMKSVSDPELQSQLATRFMFLRDQLQQEILSLVDQKIPLDSANLNEEEYMYYYNLLLSNRPYKKFIK